ncbi:hypothetical protein D7044_13950 [Micromonospora musae]|uniref:Low temperature requirement protein A n=2 Tax=Micromonospora musae TaxID=1894970 RepID=A0A3A9Y4Z1_9ACTN|nr:hypothetical protein D7044_13950 [Micromonospora musae]
MLLVYLPTPGHDLGTVVNSTAPQIAVAAAFCHGIMIAGTVVLAGSEIYIRSPLGQINAAWTLLIVGGLALNIGGRSLFGIVLDPTHRPWRGIAAVLVLAAITAGLLITPPLVVAAAVILVAVAVYLTISYRKTVARSLRMPS